MNWFLAAATLISASAMALFYILMEMNPKSPRRIPTEGREFQMPDVHFYNRPDALYTAFEQAGEDGRPRMRRYWRLDFGFIASFLLVMLIIGYNVIGASSPLYPWMALLAGVRAAFDVAENSLFLSLLSAYPARRDGLARVAGLATAAKFLTLYAWVAILFVRLATSAFGAK